MLRWREEVALPIFHLAVRTLSRSAGQSAVAAAAYRAGGRLRCDRTGRTHDFSRRSGVVATHVVVPQGETTVDRQVLWNLAEAAETRCNSTVAREIELALPCELDAAARQALALSFATALAARYGIAVDVAVHAPSGKGDDRNHHVHCLTSTRVWTAGAFGRKVRQLDDRRKGPAEITATRTMWAAMCNGALAAAGVTDTVDHRSHRERGLPEQPGHKLGPAAVGVERRTGTASRRRSEHDVGRAAPGQATGPGRERSEDVSPRDHGTDRRQAHRAALIGLRVRFAAATAAAMAGRPHQALEGVLTSTAPQRRHESTVAGHRASAGFPWSAPQVAVRSGVLTPQVVKRTRRGYDEAAEAAALYRRVDRELDAEHRAQMAEEAAEARRATSLSAFGRPTGAFAIGLAHVPSLPGAAWLGRSDHTGPEPTRHPASDKHAVRSISHRHDLRRVTADAPKPAADAPTTDGLARRGLAIMVAHELRRRHKRSRARLSCLAEVAGMNVSAFEAEASAWDETSFDPAAIAGEPALTDLWNAWEQEDRVKQTRDGKGRTDERFPAVTAGVEPAVARMPEAGPDPGDLANTNDKREDALTPAASPVRTRRDIVIDTAILVIARNGWSKDVGDALASLLRTRRDWVFREAHRVCLKRYGTGRPQSLSGDVLRTIRLACREGDAKHGQVSRALDNIDRGRIGRGIG